MKNNNNKIKHLAKQRRHQRVRAKIFGTAKIPRLSVSKSLNHVYLQLINDQTGKTIVSFHSRNIDANKKKKIDIALAAGLALAKKAAEAKIKQCVFDRGGYIYHGRIKAAADGARQGGLKF